MRGLVTAGFGIQGAGISGGYPNVAAFLDEQSAQLPHRTLDIYAVDLDRIAAGACNQSALVRQATFLWVDGTPIDFSALHTFNGAAVPNPSRVLGSPLAGAPQFQANVRARYDFAMHGYDAFAQIGALHQSHSLSSTDKFTLDVQGNSTAYDLPPFTSFNAALGVGSNAWLVQVDGENLTDARAQLFGNYYEYYKAITVNRPRTVGLRFNYKFSGS